MRLFFVFLAIVSVFVAGGVFPIHSPTPLGRTLLFLYAHVPGVAGLRTTYKVTAQLNLALALLLGFGVEALWNKVARQRRAGLWRAAVLITAVCVVASNAYPLWLGRLYDPARGLGSIPAYWQQALARLDSP